MYIKTNHNKNKTGLEWIERAKVRDNSFPKGCRKTRSVFQGEALSGLLRYYLDVSAAAGQPQFGEKRKICCEERDFIELNIGPAKDQAFLAIVSLP